MIFAADNYCVASSIQNGQQQVVGIFEGYGKLRQIGNYGVMFWGRAGQNDTTSVRLLDEFERTYAVESVQQVARDFGTFVESKIADADNLNFLIGGYDQGPQLAGRIKDCPRPNGFAPVELFGYIDGVNRLFPTRPPTMSNMPIRDAVDLAHYLVNVQIGYTRFSGQGVQICGGDIELAVMRQGRFDWIKRSMWAP